MTSPFRPRPEQTHSMSGGPVWWFFMGAMLVGCVLTTDDEAAKAVYVVGLLWWVDRGPRVHRQTD